MARGQRQSQGDSAGVSRRREADRASRTQRVDSSRGESDVQRRQGGSPRIWAPSRRTDR